MHILVRNSSTSPPFAFPRLQIIPKSWLSILQKKKANLSTLNILGFRCVGSGCAAYPLTVSTTQLGLACALYGTTHCIHHWSPNSPAYWPLLPHRFQHSTRHRSSWQAGLWWDNLYDIHGWYMFTGNPNSNSSHCHRLTTLHCSELPTLPDCYLCSDPTVPVNLVDRPMVLTLPRSYFLHSLCQICNWNDYSHFNIKFFITTNRLLEWTHCRDVHPWLLIWGCSLFFFKSESESLQCTPHNWH
jgi:hypothetical protein